MNNQPMCFVGITALPVSSFPSRAITTAGSFANPASVNQKMANLNWLATFFRKNEF
jgi:hypothetical protein